MSAHLKITGHEIFQTSGNQFSGEKILDLTIVESPGQVTLEGSQSGTLTRDKRDCLPPLTTACVHNVTSLDHTGSQLASVPSPKSPSHFNGSTSLRGGTQQKIPKAEGDPGTLQ